PPPAPGRSGGELPRLGRGAREPPAGGAAGGPAADGRRSGGPAPASVQLAAPLRLPQQRERAAPRRPASLRRRRKGGIQDRQRRQGRRLAERVERGAASGRGRR